MRRTKNKNNGRYRSKFEATFAKDLEDRSITYEYEKLTIPYLQEHTYTPDFKIGPMIIETKGRFTSFDRAKHLRVKEQHPEYDIRFVFMNSSVKLYKGSKTTYGEWCDKHGFMWVQGKLPTSWLKSSTKKRKSK